MKHFAVIAIFSFATALTVSAQEQPRHPSASDPYVPDLSIVMTITQWRHFKLSYAVEVENWELAKYEVLQVRDALAPAAKLYPVYEDVQQEKLIAEVSKPALIAIDKAIQEKNRAAFKLSFSDLTQACNSCHQQAHLGFINIRVPTKSPFSNQVFTPTKK